MKIPNSFVCITKSLSSGKSSLNLQWTRANWHISLCAPVCEERSISGSEQPRKYLPVYMSVTHIDVAGKHTFEVLAVCVLVITIWAFACCFTSFVATTNNGVFAHIFIGVSLPYSHAFAAILFQSFPLSVMLCSRTVSKAVKQRYAGIPYWAHDVRHASLYVCSHLRKGKWERRDQIDLFAKQTSFKLRCNISISIPISVSAHL